MATRERLAIPDLPPLPAGVFGAQDAARAQALVEIGLALSSTLDLDAILTLVVDRAAQLVGADGATLFLVDPATGELWSKVLRGTRLREIRLPPGRGVAGAVARSGRPAVVSDAYEDGRFDRDVDRRSGYRTRSIACAPLPGRDGRVAGVLEVVHRRPGAFGEEAQRLVAAVASQAAVAVENARLFGEAVERNAELRRARTDLEHRIAELDLLLGIEQRLSAAPDLAAGIDAVLERAIDVIGGDAGAVLLVDERTGQLYFRTARGGRPDVVAGLRLPRGKGIAGQVALRGRPILANDVSREGAFDPEIAASIGYTVRSALCVPVPTGGETLGALEVLNKEAGFTEDDLAVLSAVAAHVGAHVAAERLREERAREDRLSTIGQLLSGVMHDLRNPLTVISGFSQLMVREPDAGKRQEFCDLLVKQFELVNAMTREVLDFARGKVQVLRRKVYVNRFVSDVAEALRSDLEPAGVELRVRVSDGGEARFDEVKLRRAIVNVARNAAQAMPEGGRFSLHVSRAGDRLLFRMSDTGPGIPEEIRARLFQSFATHGKEDGTGLGLAIVKRIAEEHGGTVECRTRTGKGTTFILAIPA
jgi:GAF domain-containing protein/anti-sigma regulatory factor (Ser/Thr protein kinase)